MYITPLSPFHFSPEIWYIGICSLPSLTQYPPVRGISFHLLGLSDGPWIKIQIESKTGKTITADQIDTGAITTDKIAANAITAAKIDTTDLTVKKLRADNATNNKNVTVVNGDGIFFSA